MNAPLARATLNGSELEDIVQSVLAAAKSAGVDQAEVAASHDIGLSTTARLGDVESLEYTNDRGVGITVYKDHKKGSASTSDFSAAALQETVAKAVSFATYTAADEHSGLADPERMASGAKDLELAHEWQLNPNDAIQIAIECEDAARAYDKRITNSEGATVGTNSGVRAYGNSHGFIASYPKTSHSVSCVVVGEADGAMERDYWYTAARDANLLETAASVGQKAAERTVARLGGRKIETGTASVLYAPESARGFIGHLIGAIAGSSQYRRSSFLLDAAGERIFPEFMQLQERPHLLGAMASASYDAEGVQTSDRDIIVDGVLQGYVLGSYSARRLGLQTTGNAGGVHNLLVPGNAGDLKSMLRDMGTGLLVHELIGQGVNMVTGDYSRGVVGFWIENGEIAYPVHEITIAGNLKKLYQQIVAIGNDQDLRGGIHCGSILVEGMTIAGA
ncbi:MAG: metalloprotease PmbA [Woeseia sp.]|nr:metalloprotease PmbA [Woeseia sp.]MBT6210561.1 metalloprotease PmbA [Woeseia sp.]